jgi:hypothetical protein
MGTKAAGSWYKGTVRDLVLTHGRPGDPHYDPWDSLIVSWDIDQKTTRVGATGLEVLHAWYVLLQSTASIPSL